MDSDALGEGSASGCRMMATAQAKAALFKVGIDGAAAGMGTYAGTCMGTDASMGACSGTDA